jgi:hypothetical protein
MVVAVKVAEVNVPRARAKAHLTEVHIAGTLRHPNVVGTLTCSALHMHSARACMQRSDCPPLARARSLCIHAAI